jgi:hypothetical protein
MERGLLVELSPNEETAHGGPLSGAPQAARFDRGDGNGLQADGSRQAPACTARIGTAEATRLGVKVALRNDCPLSIRYAYDFEAFLPEMFQRCQGLSAGGTDDHDGGTVSGVSRFDNKIHDCTQALSKDVTRGRVAGLHRDSRETETPALHLVRAYMTRRMRL